MEGTNHGGPRHGARDLAAISPEAFVLPFLSPEDETVLASFEATHEVIEEFGTADAARLFAEHFVLCDRVRSGRGWVLSAAPGRHSHD